MGLQSDIRPLQRALAEATSTDANVGRDLGRGDGGGGDAGGDVGGDVGGDIGEVTSEGMETHRLFLSPRFHFAHDSHDHPLRAPWFVRLHLRFAI